MAAREDSVEIGRKVEAAIRAGYVAPDSVEIGQVNHVEADGVIVTTAIWRHPNLDGATITTAGFFQGGQLIRSVVIAVGERPVGPDAC